MESRIEQLCRDKGMKMTEQRRAIARVLSDSNDHPDVEELHRRVVEIDSRVSIATVYRTVRLFEEQHILERLDFGDGRARYEEVEGRHHHHHLINLETGEVIEFENEQLEELKRKIARDLGYDLVGERLELYGVPAGQRAEDQLARLTGAGPRMRQIETAGTAEPSDLPERNRETGDGFLSLVQGGLEARLARSREDIEAAQSLRYRVFYDEMKARPSTETAALRRDADSFDAVCDHLLVVDPARRDLPGGVVGTYRLLRRSQARTHGRFYSSDEYDISIFEDYPGETLELGRSCVERDYRNRSTMQLLWRAIAVYVFHHDIAVMFGCASLPGTDPEALGLQLSYLYYYHLAPPALRPRAIEQRFVDMRIVPREGIEPRAALGEMPPLIKGYLRLGGFVGDGAVVDHQFNTTDVSIVVKTDLVTDKYYRHYERDRR